MSRTVAPGQWCTRKALPAMAADPIWAVMVRPSPLDNPGNASFAWARYRRLMRWMAGVTVAVVLAALTVLYLTGGLASIHFVIATVLGVGAAMLLTSALMGLVFLSHGTGHDESIADPFADDPPDPTFGVNGPDRTDRSDRA